MISQKSIYKTINAKVDGITTHLFILVKPQVAPNGHPLSMIQPDKLCAGTLHFLPLLPQEG